MREFHIAVFPGDGIGREVMAPCLALLEAVVSRAGQFRLRLETHEAGAGAYRDTGVALSEKALAAAESADAILLGAMGLPDVRYPNGTEIVPQIELRERFELYAGVRPIRALPGPPIPLADPRARKMDFVLVRESTEGLFAARTLTRRDGGRAVFDTMRITRGTCERLFDYAFTLARKRRRAGRRTRVTCVDKANVLPSMAFFRSIFQERAALHADVESDCAYVDAAALRLVRSPWEFDVLVTENMFGDILSDESAMLTGSLGMLPSASLGAAGPGLFEPVHGSAPDIAGKGIANPLATFLSVAMMLRHGLDRPTEAAAIEGAVEAVLQRGLRTPDLAAGGVLPAEVEVGTEEITDAVLEELRA
jgi:3-isopropylmalate dehydrogenase